MTTVNYMATPLWLCGSYSAGHGVDATDFTALQTMKPFFLSDMAALKKCTLKCFDPKIDQIDTSGTDGDIPHVTQLKSTINLLDMLYKLNC